MEGKIKVEFIREGKFYQAFREGLYPPAGFLGEGYSEAKAVKSLLFREEQFDALARSKGYLKDESFSLISRSDAEELVEMYYDPQGVHLDRFMEKMEGVMKGLRRGLIEKSKREGR